MSLDAVALTAMYESHKASLWGLGYRMLGTADDADDVLQETFVRLIEHPPADASLPLFPWLVRTAMRIARDELRTRKTRDYQGPWLPGPVQTARLEIPGAAYRGRYGLEESASFSFVLALEALNEDQRAVLILRDVLTYSAAETATALELTEADVNTAQQHARETLKPFDEARLPLGAELYSQTGSVLTEFLAALAAGDTEAAASLLAEDVRALCDGAGEFDAPEAPVLGRDAVTQLCMKLATERGPESTVQIDSFNSLPAAIALGGKPRPGAAERLILRVDLNAAGSIQELHCVLATGKLGALWGYGAAEGY